jgi:hypothetical protein
MTSTGFGRPGDLGDACRYHGLDTGSIVAAGPDLAG